MIKVAIVEDSLDILQVWNEILQTTVGFTCVGCFNDYTTAMVQLPKVDADVVLMDIHLSKTESGIELIKMVKYQCVKSQFLMFTVFDDDEAIFEALRAGAAGYILKSTSSNKVLEAIAELHAGGAPMSAGIARRVITSFQGPTKPNANMEALLQPMERKLLELLAKGLFYKEVAEDMKLSIHSVKQYCHSIYRKLEVSNRTEALNKYYKK